MKYLIVFSILVITASSVIGQGTALDPVSRAGKGFKMNMDKSGARWFESSNSSSQIQMPLNPEAADTWDNLFNKGNGYDSLIDKGLITSFASDNNYLYVGGSFEFFNGLRCYNIIRYNRSTKIWSKMDSGFSSTVNIIKVHNGKVYAGGRFGYVGFDGDRPIGRIAVWDEATGKWEQVGGGVNNSVSSMEFMDSSLIIGGYFTVADTSTVSYIARWNGHEWDDMAGGVSDVVYTLLASGDSLFVGGTFYTRSQGLPSGIGLYTGGSWQTVGDGLDGSVSALAMIKGQLWVGGDFSSTAHDKKELYSLAVWDGSDWNAFSNGTEIGTIGGSVEAITQDGDDVYIGGRFNKFAGVTAHSIIKWKSGALSPIGKGIYGDIHAISLFNGSIFIGGNFRFAGNDSVGNLAVLSAGNLGQLNPPVFAYGGYSETYINTVATTPQYVFIGGAFSTIGGKVCNHIAAWDKYSRQWISLGKGVDEDVYSITVQGSNVYVGGAFDYAGDSVAEHIAFWDMNTKTWHPMGQGSVRYVSSIAANETGIYASVYFPLVLDFGLVNYIGQWDGTKWNQIDGGINGYVNAIAADHAKLYIGGSIRNINQLLCHNIAEYSEGNWLQLGEGVSDRVLSIALAGTDSIYAAGDFYYSGSSPVRGIALWNGNIWSDLDGGLNSPANTLAMKGNSLYVGGRFGSTNGGLIVNYLAKWNGTNWSTVSNGVGSNVYGLAVDQAGLYCGGSFNHVNGTKLNSYRFGILHFGNAGVDDPLRAKNSVENFPNPFYNETTIHYCIAKEGLVRMEIFDLLGTKVKALVNAFQSSGEYDVNFNAEDLPAGTYFCSLIANGITSTRPMNLVK